MCHAARGAEIVHLLIIENDDAVAAAIGTALGRSGRTWQRCRSGAEALLHYREHDVLLLALNLPDVDGLEVLRRLRAVSGVPVVALTVGNNEREVVRALQLGADDCLAKPPRTEELLARIEVVARRRVFTTEATQRSLVKVGELCLDLDARTIIRGTRVVTLTKTEFNILALLCAGCGAVVPRVKILTTIWGASSLSASRSLDVHLTRLRAKLGSPQLITTVWGFGYRVG